MGSPNGWVIPIEWMVGLAVTAGECDSPLSVWLVLRMAREVKVSYHTQTARKTAGHNDRSAYGKSHEYGGDASLNNHWDCYDCGSSVDAERRLYEDRFGDRLREQNERYVRNRHAERVKSMDEYMSAHPPRESVVQLGDKDTQIRPGYLERAANLLSVEMRKAGCILISIDIHYDRFEDENGDVREATPHMHIRWIGITNDGSPNLSKTLEEHGVLRPKPDKPRSRYNNELMVFTAEMRDRLEDLADEYLGKVNADVKLNRDRKADAKHLEPEEYRRKQRLKDRERHVEQRELLFDAEAEYQNSLLAERERLALFAARENAAVMAEVAVGYELEHGPARLAELNRERVAVAAEVKAAKAYKDDLDSAAEQTARDIMDARRTLDEEREAFEFEKADEEERERAWTEERDKIESEFRAAKVEEHHSVAKIADGFLTWLGKTVPRLSSFCDTARGYIPDFERALNLSTAKSSTERQNRARGKTVHKSSQHKPRKHNAPSRRVSHGGRGGHGGLG